MTIARYISGLDIINRVAPEVGLEADANAYSSQDPMFKQLIQLLNSCGQNLNGAYDWQQFHKEGSIVTTGSPNRYDVPEDYSRFCPATGFEDGQLRPLGGPVSPQQWAVAVGQDLASPLHVHYREAQNQFWLLPVDTAAGITINFEYLRRTWVLNGAEYKDTTDDASDIIEYEPVLVVAMLKWRFLAAKGFASDDAKSEFLTALGLWLGKGTSAPTLNLARFPRNPPYIESINAGGSTIGS